MGYPRRTVVLLGAELGLERGDLIQELGALSIGLELRLLRLRELLLEAGDR